jgi:uncharacterized protein (DUF58 family)
MYLMVSAFIGAAAFNSQTNLLFWTFGLMVGVLIVSAVLSGFMMRGLVLRRILPDHGAADEAMVLRYELSNTNWLLPGFGLVITELEGVREGTLRGKPHGWVLHIGPRATLQAEAVAWPVRRGTIHFNRVRITSTFPFGILRRSVTFSQPGRVVVYPRLFRLRREQLRQVRSRDPAGSRNSEHGGGSEEFFGLRDYRPGDTTRLIDWKHTARMGRLVARDLTRLTPPKLIVLLNLRNLGDVPRACAERAISFAASLVCEAHMEGFDGGLAVAGVMCPSFTPHHSRWHRTRVLHALGDVDLSRPQENVWALPPSRDLNWVVIHAGEVDRGFGPAGAMHLSQAELESWCQRPEAPRASGALAVEPAAGVR